MARSLGLAAYRAVTRRADAQYHAPDVERPSGALIWLHVGEAQNALAVRDLAKRLIALESDVSALITHDSASVFQAGHDRLIETAVPSENPAAIAAFLAHWSPDVGVWIWGNLRPNLILEAAAQKCTLLLIDADIGGFEQKSNRWLPDITRQVLSQFSVICCRSVSTSRRLATLGAVQEHIEVTSPLLAGGEALGCADSDLADLSSAMGGRPAWFADGVASQECPIVMAAHKMALRLSHRLLLILRPATPDDTKVVEQCAAEQGLGMTHWDDGQFPDETDQVMIATDPQDRGLFLRVSPVSFMGTTLITSTEGNDPLEAAALGSAVLYGPKVNQYLPSYSRLAAAGAARIVNDATTLGAAVARLIAPDQAATMAHAGWDVISQGAGLADRVLELVQDVLDEKVER